MKKIALVTGTRAEYGLLKTLIRAIQNDQDFQLQLIVTGMHLMAEFGNTYQEIEQDGFTIDARVEDGLDGDTSAAITKSMGRAMVGFADVFERLKPDLLIVLGDRSEILVAVTAAMIASIPVAHIHGGETTEGAYDEFIRHAITKMSHLHFASTEAYRNRIIQLGENPTKVFNVGAIGIDSIRRLELLDKKSFEASISKKLDKKAVLVTFHPVTLEDASSEKQFQALLQALDILKDTTLIFTKPNSDKGGHIISKMIDDYVTQKPAKAISFHSLGQLRYLSALQYVDFVIGNSSSGILEVPYFKIPTINIGDRQKGRIMPSSVINCTPEYEHINRAITLAGTNQFLSKIQQQQNLYGEGNATHQIIKQIKKFDFTQKKKSFYDLNTQHFEKL